MGQARNFKINEKIKTATEGSYSFNGSATNRTIRPFVVAFNRNRDFYQLPLALYEEDLLAGLVTDLYAPPLGPFGRARPLNKLAARRVNGLPFGKVSWNWEALRLQLLNLKQARDGVERAAVYKQIDVNLSRAALRLALRSEADLFLYSGYAREAFESPLARDLTKGLFVFHPHGRLSLPILEADIERHPEVSESHRWHREEILLTESDRLDSETKAADFLVCASSFTARSLAGIRSEKQHVSIVPYGCFCERVPVASIRKPGPARFLFVGQGVQRKGLHHLLKAWRILKPSNADLTLVASFLDPGVRRLADQPGVSESDVFIMPSLIEGFGLVYLEALVAGCFAIGTENTGLPDLNLPEDVGQVLPPGDLEALRTAIERAILLVSSGSLDRRKISRYARGASWERFRRKIRQTCRTGFCSAIEENDDASNA